MNAELHVRFWENVKQGLPNDTRPVSYWNNETELYNSIVNWMFLHRDGKVEFVFV